MIYSLHTPSLYGVRRTRRPCVRCLPYTTSVYGLHRTPHPRTVVTVTTALYGLLAVQVERVVGDLEEARAVGVEDDMNLAALNLGMIAAYYYIQYTTIELFANSVTAKTKLRSVKLQPPLCVRRDCLFACVA